MKKIFGIVFTVFIVIFGGILIGIVAGILIGPQATSNPDTVRETRDTGISQDALDALDALENGLGFAEDMPPPVLDLTLAGKWELVNAVEVDPSAASRIAAETEYFDDGTGRAYYEGVLLPQEFKWEAEGGRLTITPADATMRISAYDYELSGNTLTIFYNTNRTSYTESRKVG